MSVTPKQLRLKEKELCVHSTELEHLCASVKSSISEVGETGNTGASPYIAVFLINVRAICAHPTCQAYLKAERIINKALHANISMAHIDSGDIKQPVSAMSECANVNS